MIPKPMFQAFAALVFLLFIFITALILGGCRPTPDPDTDGADDVADMIRRGQIQYTVDPNTGHCFAVAWITDGLGDHKVGGAVITWVPCEAERP
jgi:hypothetical protein